MQAGIDDTVLYNIKLLSHLYLFLKLNGFSFLWLSISIGKKVIRSQIGPFLFQTLIVYCFINYFFFLKKRKKDEKMKKSKKTKKSLLES